MKNRWLLNKRIGEKVSVLSLSSIGFQYEQATIVGIIDYLYNSGHLATYFIAERKDDFVAIVVETQFEHYLAVHACEKKSNGGFRII